MRAKLASLSLAAALYTSTAAAGDTEYEQAIAAMQRGAFTQAIERFELLADRGMRHQHLSFNRGLSYAARAESRKREPGDLGRAAAAFSEALASAPDDDEAREALRLVREEIGRRRAREGAPQIMAEPRMARALAGVANENVWAAGSIAGSSLLSVGLVLKLFKNRDRLRLSGTIVALIGAVLFAVFGSLTVAARHFRVTSKPAIVVVREARLLDESGSAAARGQHGDVVIEGSLVHVLKERGRLVFVEWGTTRGWIQRSQLQVIRGG